jgi:hypothetical protein
MTKMIILSSLCMELCQNFVWKLPDGICKLDPKSNKFLEHQINQSERKKSMFSTLKRNGAKNLYRSYATEFAGLTCLSKHQINQSERKFSQKKCMFITLKM